MAPRQNSSECHIGQVGLSPLPDSFNRVDGFGSHFDEQGHDVETDPNLQKLDN